MPSLVGNGKMRQRLVHVMNHFRSGAVPNIIRDLQPVLARDFDVSVVVLQDINRQDRAYQDFAALGIPVRPLGLARWDLPRATLRLTCVLRKIKPSVVHAHMGRSELIAPVCRPKQARLFATFHGVREGYHPATRSFIRFTDALLDERICISEAVAASWYGANRPRRVSVIHNPVDIDRFMPSDDARERILREFRLPANTLLLVTVGRLNKGKGHRDLLDALALLVRHGYGDVHLLVAGRGGEEQNLRAAVRQLKLENHVHLVGFRNDVPSLVAAADIFVFPSHWEGLGLAALEAMATGTAVVASDLPAIREYVRDGETGLLSPPADAQALFERLRRMIEDVRLRERLAAHGMAAVRQDFSSRRIAERYRSRYMQAAQ